MRSQWRWYVYQLVDPRTGKPFYVGKGSGKRIDAHELQARRGVCSRKTQRINEIENLGLSVQKEFLAFFCDEQAAYDHETDVIDEIGLANLTNVLPGGQKAWERRQKERAERRPAPIVIDWHDIASRIAYVVRASDGLTKQISLRVSDSVEFAKYRNAIGEAIDKAYGSMTEFARLVIGQMRIKKGDKFVADEFAKYGIVFV